jgi:hypothetical protein
MAGWRLASLTQMADMFANMKGPTFKLALLALSALLCAARGALAVGPPYPGGLRTSQTTSRTSRARSQGRGRLRGGRIAFAAFSLRLRPWACWCWLACRRAPCCHTDTWGCHHAAARRLADTCGPPPPACCCSPWVVRSWCAVKAVSVTLLRCCCLVSLCEIACLP